MSRRVAPLALLLATACTFATSSDPDDATAFGTPAHDLGMLPALPLMEVPPPTPPQLFTTQLSPGAVFDVALSPVANHTQVYFFVSLAGPGSGPCHPTQPVCLDIRSAVQLGRDTADSSGVALVSRTVPNSVASRPTAWLQAVALYQGSIYKTPVLELPIVTSPVDTFDTDTGISHPITITDTTTTDIHGGLHGAGQYLRVPGLVVTAVRVRANPPGSNAFVAQDPTVSTNAGIFVSMGAATNLPAVGDEVTVVGQYDEAGTGVRATSLSRLVVNATTLPGTEVTVTQSGLSLPPAVDLQLVDLQQSNSAEPYESMRVRLLETTVLDVVSNPLTNGDFRVSTAGTADQAVVEEEFYDVRTSTGPTLNVGDTFTWLSGVLHFEVNAYKLAPVSGTDVVGYTDR